MLALNGAQMIFVPTATTDMSRYLWELELQAHAVDNVYYVGGVNRVGVFQGGSESHFYGSSMWVDPKGPDYHPSERHRGRGADRGGRPLGHPRHPQRLGIPPRSPARSLRRVDDLMDLGLEGKVALVTGASRGIGRAIALALAREGVAVAATARSGDDLDETVRAMDGDRHCAVVGDVTDPDGIAAAVGEATDALGPIDIVVNNAGQRQDFGRLDELDVEEWQRVVEANLSSALYVTRAIVAPG